jgi:hypothetical protein
LRAQQLIKLGMVYKTVLNLVTNSHERNSHEVD